MSCGTTTPLHPDHPYSMGDDVMRDINTTFDCFDDLICSEEEDEDDDGGGCGDIKIEVIPPGSEWGDDVGWDEEEEDEDESFWGNDYSDIKNSKNSNNNNYNSNRVGTNITNTTNNNNSNNHSHNNVFWTGQKVVEIKREIKEEIMTEDEYNNNN